MVTILIVPTYATSNEEQTSELVYISGPIIAPRSNIEFVEGQTIEFSYEFVYYENGEEVHEIENITTVMELSS